MFFVLSSGRSGSKTIAETFQQFPHCACLHHPAPELVEEASDYFYDGSGADEIRNVLRQTRPMAAAGELYGEVNLQLSLLVPILIQLFPACKFIWLIRDGRESVASMYDRGWYDPSNTRVPKEWHNARLQGDRTGDFAPEAWSGLTRFERCCWIWKKYNLVIEDELGRLDKDRWRHVRLEQLKQTLPELASFLGLTWRRVLVEKHNVALQPVRRWEAWEEERRRHFETVCGNDMDRWYPNWRDANGRWHPIDAEQPDRPGAWVQAQRRIRKEASRVIKGIRHRLGG